MLAKVMPHLKVGALRRGGELRGGGGGELRGGVRRKKEEEEVGVEKGQDERVRCALALLASTPPTLSFSLSLPLSPSYFLPPTSHQKWIVLGPAGWFQNARALAPRPVAAEVEDIELFCFFISQSVDSSSVPSSFSLFVRLLRPFSRSASIKRAEVENRGESSRRRDVEELRRSFPQRTKERRRKEKKE